MGEQHHRVSDPAHSHDAYLTLGLASSAIENSPFSYPQNLTTCERYEGFGLRLVCFLLRARTEEFPLEMSWTSKQARSARRVIACLDDATTTDEMWDEAIHRLMVSIFFDLPRNFLRESDKHPIAIFTMLLNLHPTTGNFAKCSTVAGRLSALIYLFRVVAVDLIRREADRRAAAGEEEEEGEEEGDLQEFE
jgi:hypothetical protein